MAYLVVAAHPDDEVLGAGGTIYKLTQAGERVEVCILSSQAKARAFRPEDDQLHSDMKKSLLSLGVEKTYEGDFPNIELNTVPHLKLVQFIENAIIESHADNIITHHPADLNNDHLHTSLACQAAVRLFQRRKDVPPVKAFYYMEVPSATDWGLNTSMRSFKANTFVEIGKDGLDKKIESLAMYRGVMRDYPHPRSREAICGLSAYRGAQVDMKYAEAFECVFKRGL